MLPFHKWARVPETIAARVARQSRERRRGAEPAVEPAELQEEGEHRRRHRGAGAGAGAARPGRARLVDGVRPRRLRRLDGSDVEGVKNASELTGYVANLEY